MGSINGWFFAANGYTCSLTQGFTGRFLALLNRCFRKCGEKSDFADQTGFLATKPQVTRAQKSSVLGGLEFFPALPKYESAEGVNKPIYATYVQ